MAMCLVSKCGGFEDCSNIVINTGHNITSNMTWSGVNIHCTASPTCITVSAGHELVIRDSVVTGDGEGGRFIKLMHAAHLTITNTDISNFNIIH